MIKQRWKLEERFATDTWRSLVSKNHRKKSTHQLYNENESRATNDLKYSIEEVSRDRNIEK